MKKLLCMITTLVLTLGMLCVNVSADNVIVRKPVQCDVTMGNSTYVTETKNADNVITGRKIDASKSSSTTLASIAGASMKLRPIVSKTDGGYSFGGATSQLKTNFTWQFDFSLSGTIPTSTDQLRMQFGSNWKNKLYFVALDDTHYYIQWSTVPDAYVNEPNKSTVGSAYVLEKGKTYRLKIETSFENDMVYVTFTNPYIDASGNANENPNWTNSYERTTVSKGTLSFSLKTAADAKYDKNRFGISIVDTTKKSVIEMSSETFIMDRLFSSVPELSVSGDSVIATANAINIPDFGYTGKLPSVFCAIYQGDKLVDCAVSTPSVTSLSYLTDSKYNATVENLPNGTYTVKAFVWNSVDEMQPYPNCLVEKTLTVTDGVGTLN